MLGEGFFWIPVKGMDFAYVYLWVKDKTTSVRTERSMSMLTAWNPRKYREIVCAATGHSRHNFIHLSWKQV